MLLGYSLINGEPHEGNGATFAGVDPMTGVDLEPAYHYAPVEDVDLEAVLGGGIRKAPATVAVLLEAAEGGV